MHEMPRVVETRQGATGKPHVPIDPAAYERAAVALTPAILQAARGNREAAAALFAAGLDALERSGRPDGDPTDWSLSELDIGPRLADTLEDALGILTVGALVATPRLLVEAVAGVGPKAIAELDRRLAAIGVTWPVNP